ncbi:LysR family transcriptional regulator [Janthinobacterium agaricidamnosum]|uniref:Bacterial regulatory helix-turn-helix, lysR family protein n=1 Tax=Janthinobacterium agaricidamnosum NBRC 102515 = DSM 9628 TaxID=1349767 RepID=W0VDM2_9BURK|nr:LysR family transcriptional regulator [Janthinobacterium agaricidamnosum]CDG86011.1 bacterial regulatory helix-turn-helix, lysR family protein [Janthinobacterium agaricidamnosum NBRC 102515 = DSM 9628]
MLNRLEMLRIFCSAADTGSFKEAAIRLGISPQAVTRAVQELEQLQGELLFHRNTRQVQITAFGEALAERARSAVQQLDALFEPHVDDDELAGLVRIAAPASLAKAVILPVLTSIAARYTKINFDLRLSDERADVVNDKIDIGIRIGPLRDNRFVVRLAAKMQLRVVATPDCIARHGVPVTCTDLDRVPTAAMYDSNTGRPWPWIFAGGQHAFPDGARFVCDDAEAELMAVLAGMAFGQAPSFLADQHIAAGRLVAVMQALDPAPWDMYIYRPQRGPMSARLRLVFDALGAALAQCG